MVFFKGSIGYQDFLYMPVVEIMDWCDRAKKINDNFNAEVEKAKRQTRR